MPCSSRPGPRSGPRSPSSSARPSGRPGSDSTPAHTGIRRRKATLMVIADPDRDRKYALEFARGALRHYYRVGPDQLALRERNTNLTTGDLLATAVEQLLEELDPGG